MRVLRGSLGGVRDAGIRQELDGPRAGVPLRREAMDEKDLRDLRADRLQRVERRRGVLRDEADARAAHGAPLEWGEGCEIEAVVAERIRADFSARREEVDDRLRDARLAGAGLTDDRDLLARVDVEGDAGDGERRGALVRELEAAHGEQGLGGILRLSHGR